MEIEQLKLLAKSQEIQIKELLKAKDETEEMKESKSPFTGQNKGNRIIKNRR